MRFLCDEMLARLARLLRAAGYDTALAEAGERDTSMLDRARADGRMLVTRDRELAARAGPAAVLLKADAAQAQARALAAVLPIDWRLAPFTRCVMDNAPLREATAQEVAAMPAKAQAGGGPFRACPACGRLYWPGSHVKRMAARLSELRGQA
jgi:uncharacterized protein with PIN domain